MATLLLKDQNPYEPGEPCRVDGRASAQHSIRRHLAIGVTTVALLVGGVGGWALTTELSGAVIASGLLVVESDAAGQPRRARGRAESLVR